MDRRKVLSVQRRTSEHNVFENESLASIEYYKAFGKLQEMNAEAGRRVVTNIVDSVFQEEQCREHVSKSSCSVQRQPADCESMDKRLKQWYDTLRDRAKLQLKLSKRTGRHPMHMLCNLPVSTNSHEKGNMLRLMDLARRMHPVSVKDRRYGVLPAVGDCVPEVWQTTPSPERKGHAAAEISGLPRQTKTEVLGTRNDKAGKDTRTRNRWINSKVLANSTEKNIKNISRVLKYYPQISKLEVIGKSALQGSNFKHTSNISLVQNMSLKTISSTTTVESVVMPTEPTVPIPIVVKPKIVNLGIKINGISYEMPATNATQAFPTYSEYFECAPFQRQMKEVVRLENIGRKIITCEWHMGNSLHHLRKEHDNCFFISHMQFKLLPGDVVTIRIMFQPRSVLVRRQRYVLQMHPNINELCHNALVLRLWGKSVPAPEYCQQIDKQMKQIVDKVSCSIANNLTNHHAELVPLIKPHEQPCPYERSLDDREVFNSLNLGYHCERFDDIEMLRSLYNGLKLPRDSPWDMRLDTIKQLILRMPKLENREFYFQTLLELLDSIGRSRGEPMMHDGHSCEQERSCLIYVRGCLASSIEECVELMDALELSCLKVELAHFFAQAEAEEKEGEEASYEEDQNDLNDPWMQLKRNNPVLYVLKKMRSHKYYQDSLYIQTYTQLCDMVENVVSIIESTRVI